MEIVGPDWARVPPSGVDPWSAAPPSRLLTALSGGGRLISVIGGRFSGKTSLLRLWLARQGAGQVPVAHVLEPDPDLTEDGYWALVLVSLCPQVDPGDDPFQTLCAVLDDADAPVVLLLDDVHLLASPELRIVQLLRRGHPRSRVIAATRTAGHWADSDALSAVRTVLGPDELAMFPKEIEAVAEAAGAGFSRQFAQICGRESGGLVCLVAAAIATGVGMQHSDEMTQLVREAIDRVIDRELTGDPRLIVLRPALLRLAAATPITLSAATAILPRAPGGTENASEVLNELELLGLLHREARELIKGTAEGTWTIPEAVRASLVRVARADDPDQLREVRLTLAQHWLDAGYARTAFVHAIDAGQWDLVLAILRADWRTLHISEPVQMQHDLAKIPRSVFEGEPLFGSLQDLYRRFNGPKDSPTALADVQTVPDLPTSTGQVINAITLRSQGQFSASVEQCEPLIHRHEPNPESSTQDQRDTYGFSAIQISISLIFVGRFDDAIPLLRSGHRVGAGTYIERDTAGKLAFAHAILGNLLDAEKWIDEERCHPQLEPHIEPVVRPAGMVAAALSALDRLRTREALAVLTELGPPADSEEFWGFILYAHSLHALTTGSAADGMRFLDHHARRFTMMRHNGAVVGPLLDAVRADLFLALGRPDAAARTLAADDHPLTAAARARTCLASGDAAGALELCNTYQTDLRCTVRDSIELDVAGAAASLQLADRDDAARLLERAAARIRLTGLRRAFTTVGPAALHELATLGPQIPSAALAAAPVPERLPRPTLTERELVILRSLVSGASTRMLAAEHFVSVNTIKSQLRSIYRKLGTRTREQTVDRAHTLGLL